eukprot:CAMPEP_0118983868 /NCGR_PEP_ID=MMETSP1173-20130426/36494_1 /TAXON_ID=1034831 /ORGANISM="Rhizochromulina marina cf, Strain CCMP1243" /LENGTH=102 /DNA_ID=CAMNT_0006934491 /DNA_START=525 /DNA_END=833 /DNA_ORIENTATION=-
MDAEDLPSYHSSNGQHVETIHKATVDFGRLPPDAFIVEPVGSVEGLALVVPSEDEECVGELELVAEEEADALQALLPAIHVVSKKQEAVRLRRFPVLLEEVH